MLNFEFVFNFTSGNFEIIEVLSQKFDWLDYNINLLVEPSYQWIINILLMLSPKVDIE